MILENARPGKLTAVVGFMTLLMLRVMDRKLAEIDLA